MAECFYRPTFCCLGPPTHLIQGVGVGWEGVELHWVGIGVVLLVAASSGIGSLQAVRLVLSEIDTVSGVRKVLVVRQVLAVRWVWVAKLAWAIVLGVEVAAFLLLLSFEGLAVIAVVGVSSLLACKDYPQL